ncbi:MAG: hypothetical protein LAP87_06830 [Acidobacteriia bacterium]|nr:hypothetical protein [Terriglobia bacterium]
MADEPATTTYTVTEPFEEAVKSLRKVLAGGNLKITGELDMSYRIRQRLLVGTAPCRVLFVGGTPAVFQNLGADALAAALTPLHIVVSARGSQTEIHLLRALASDNGPLEPQVAATFRRLQAEIFRAIEKIGMRAALGA